MSITPENLQNELYHRIRDILNTAYTGVFRTINTAQVLSNWLIGKEIVEEEQKGKQRADYGENLLKNLATQLTQDFGKGYSLSTLKLTRQFYNSFPNLITIDQIGYALRSQFAIASEGKGFAFIKRQERITLDGDHFYIDLVFYHTILKCYILIDLKVGKLTHGDLGQLQLYVNYYDQERCNPDDNPTLGLILCSDKNDAVVKYTLGPEQQNKIFASRYKLYLPTEAELCQELFQLQRHLNQ